MDTDYPGYKRPMREERRHDKCPPDGILPQYKHLKGMAECMPVIRKLLGLSEYGRLPDSGIGRVLQRCIENHSENAVRES